MFACFFTPSASPAGRVDRIVQTRSPGLEVALPRPAVHCSQPARPQPGPGYSGRNQAIQTIQAIQAVVQAISAMPRLFRRPGQAQACLTVAQAGLAWPVENTEISELNLALCFRLSTRGLFMIIAGIPQTPGRSLPHNFLPTRVKTKCPGKKEEIVKIEITAENKRYLISGLKICPALPYPKTK
ncbi:hypothetical protein L211DRAFT_848519 [Terfezia boudieri ATCC MYA-4762]|uniref:Uncharacterized protein n=1 Tax=Terfezia boudieri ATCC MYA-4762 TaxID=1051890 RepID=A0A3N4LP38_9PEZI|nr:hypothetical protein L211DRAFT_848519 [Terfezia boudieri ATCC MYA-4762]